MNHSRNRVTDQDLPLMAVRSHYFIRPALAEEINAYYQSGRAKIDHAEVAITSQLIGYRQGRSSDIRVESLGRTIFEIEETLLSSAAFYAIGFPGYLHPRMATGNNRHELWG